MRRIAAGDGSAFSALLELYWRPLVAYADRFLDDPDAADDAVQQAFVRLWERRAQWHPTGTVRSYLYRSVRNLVIDAARQRRTRDRFRRMRLGVRKVSVTPVDVLEGNELLAAAERAIQALPEKRREVFTLGHLQHLSYREIAEIMGISPQTVANHMSLALADLRTALAPAVDAGSGGEIAGS